MTVPFVQPTFRTPNLGLDYTLSNWRDDQYGQNLLYGVLEWCKWSMLDIGGYQNVSVGDVSGIYGGSMSTMRAAQDPNYPSGIVWEAIRSDWVWEQHITYPGILPTVCSGVYVNGVFHLPSDVTYGHYINFPLGQIIFNNPLPLNSRVNTSYSYRAVSFVKSKEEWFEQLLYNSLKVQRSDFLSATGAYSSHLAQARRQMPVVGVELVNRRDSKPYELGSLSQEVSQDVLFYICAETDTDRDQLVDILANQQDKEIVLLDRAAMRADSRFPMTLDYRGTPVSGVMYYPDLVSAFAFPSLARISRCTTQSMSTINNWLYRGVVRLTFSTIL